jgi:hypothetical protein
MAMASMLRRLCETAPMLDYQLVHGGRPVGDSFCPTRELSRGEAWPGNGEFQ